MVIRRIFKYVGRAIICLGFVVVSSALLYRTYLQHRVAEKRAITSLHGVDSLEAVRIGGSDQWIEVRGHDLDHPILLFIHGGPGVAFIPLAGAFQGTWEKHFTVVQWDQRGAGKTYESNDKELQRKTMNIPQMEQQEIRPRRRNLSGLKNPVISHFLKNNRNLEMNCSSGFRL